MYSTSSWMVSIDFVDTVQTSSSQHILLNDRGQIIHITPTSSRVQPARILFIDILMRLNPAEKVYSYYMLLSYHSKGSIRRLIYGRHSVTMVRTVFSTPSKIPFQNGNLRFRSTEARSHLCGTGASIWKEEQGPLVWWLLCSIIPSSGTSSCGTGQCTFQLVGREMLELRFLSEESRPSSSEALQGKRNHNRPHCTSGSIQSDPGTFKRNSTSAVCQGFNPNTHILDYQCSIFALVESGYQQLRVIDTRDIHFARRRHGTFGGHGHSHPVLYLQSVLPAR